VLVATAVKLRPHYPVRKGQIRRSNWLCLHRRGYGGATPQILTLHGRRVQPRFNFQTFQAGNRFGALLVFEVVLDPEAH